MPDAPFMRAHTLCVLLPCPLCRAYVSGRLQPGPFHLVAPFFKFPPVAMPPPLEAIPESVTPTAASSASRASSSQDLSIGSLDQAGRSSPELEDPLQPDSMAEVSSICLHSWIAPPSFGDAEEGGAAAGSSNSSS
jgi:hypothetical protein